MSGPYIQIATFCEKVLQEKDDVISVIRAVDRLTLTAPPDAPDQLPDLAINSTLIIAMKADQAQGRHPIIIRPQEPSGRYLEDRRIEVFFEGGTRTVNLILPFEVKPIQEGRYWFDILCSDSLLTRVPLQVVYRRLPASG